MTKTLDDIIEEKRISNLILWKMRFDIVLNALFYGAITGACIRYILS